MKPTWLIENFTRDNFCIEFIDEVKRQDFDCTVLNSINHFSPDVYKQNDCVLFHGSIQLFNKIRAELIPKDIRPIGWLTDENYQCYVYYPIFREFLFNNMHVFTTVRGIKKNKWDYYGFFGKNALIYVRPSSGDKSFTGQLIDLQDFDKFWTNSAVCSVKDDDVILVAAPKNIRGEWRFIVTRYKEILGVSTYMYNEQRTYVPSAPPGAIELCQKILSVGWYPDPVFTIDICEDNEGKFYLLEFNSFTTASTYAAKKDLIVKRVSKIAQEEWEKVKNEN